ncbi:hypothetical protein PsorP6_004361 [Peronosclerospora sorghi]|uniref:Uncharacterized protein n=1 Tax=Peronosclerospora sorghi TaxID=230839 RepID=A0ACC0VN68_9STRA|nr:hypothetical protein PsorP6_004361 [Peronosclerospora sorghi]
MKNFGKRAAAQPNFLFVESESDKYESVAEVESSALKRQSLPSGFTSCHLRNRRRLKRTY